MAATTPTGSLGHEHLAQRPWLELVEGVGDGQPGVVVEDHRRGEDLAVDAPRHRRTHLGGDQLGDPLHVGLDGVGHLGERWRPARRASCCGQGPWSKAWRAAATARSTSASVESGTRPATSSVVGLITSMVPVPGGLTQSPADEQAVVDLHVPSSEWNMFRLSDATQPLGPRHDVTGGRRPQVDPGTAPRVRLGPRHDVGKAPSPGQPSPPVRRPGPRTAADPGARR